MHTLFLLVPNMIFIKINKSDRKIERGGWDYFAYEQLIRRNTLKNTMTALRNIRGLQQQI